MARYLENRIIPAANLHKQITVTHWQATTLSGHYAEETIDTKGELTFSGENHIVLRYYRRNPVTKRAHGYYKTIYKQDFIGYEET